MEKMQVWKVFYLDKEQDIRVKLFKRSEDELAYYIDTPNHNTGNLITNLAKVCKVETRKNDEDKRIIMGIIPASLNANNEEVYIFRLGGIKIANIYTNGLIEMKAKIPAITKILMAQTKDYKLSIEKTIVKTYILKKVKFRTDLHTHLNAMLTPDILIALAVKHQIRYPLYFINKLGLSITDEQKERLSGYEKILEKRYENIGLEGKAYSRKIKDETYINFADLILNNIENAEENIRKIKNSLVLIKDGQAVFTNLDKLYIIYRYVFTKGRESEIKINYTEKQIDKIPDEDIKKYLYKMIEDKKSGSKYEKNNILKDKMLWISREYQKQGIKHVEISTTDLVKKGSKGVEFLKTIHEILPLAEEETGVEIRFLAAIRRVWLTPKEIVEALDVLKAMAKNPYVVGSDIIGEEINDISDFRELIAELVKYAVYENKDFTIQIHAGENDSHKDNVYSAIQCIKDAVPEGEKCPRVRIGHGLYVENLHFEKGQKLMQDMKDMGVVLQFQLSSNVRLNNLSDLKSHPIKTFLENGVRCVQGTDGFGIYGTDTFEEQLASQNLLDMKTEDFMKMREVEDEIIEVNRIAFERKSQEFKKLTKNKTLEEAILELEEENFEKSKNKSIKFYFKNNLEASEVLKNKIVKLPTDKFPVIIAGGSFNTKGRETVINESAKSTLKELIDKLDNKKTYFVVGPKMEGYEKAIIDLSKEMNKKFEINAIVPKMLSEEEKIKLQNDELNGVCISTETEELGIYKSFNYEIFERRNSALIAFDGNSPAYNLIQEAKNGKGKAKIFVSSENLNLKEKANSLDGYVIPFKYSDSIADKILKDYPELGKNN
jgi:adenosine deaminase